ncbi:hypothetical protein GGI12_002027 [Dipsacomyces acuminosporus]|nr:hypothetical protein GGI12_002027 [Dipsacomyces acuminosporus]
MSKGLPFDLAEGEDVPDLYELLEAKRDATEEELRKAYRKRALRTHPDKWAHLDPESEEAKSKTQEFQMIGFAYSILKDAKKRKIYDQTGSVEDLADVIEEGKDWDAYFRELWSGVVDAATIEQFAKTYKGSDEERSDIINAYRLHDGDLDLIFTEVMLSDIVEDEQRFIDAIESAIKSKEIKRTKVFTKSKKLSKERAKRAQDEAEEAEALRKELGLDDKLRKAKKDSKKSKRKRGGSKEGGDGEGEEEEDEDADEGAIRTLIRQRTNSRMNAIIANIEEKYTAEGSTKKGKKGKRGKQAKSMPAFSEPSEEEFLALQAKLFGKK